MAENGLLAIMFMSGPDDGRVLYFSPEQGHGHAHTDGSWSLSVGRRQDCDVSIPFDTLLSRQHALLRRTPDGRLWLIDAGSMNGTFVDETRIEKPTPIMNGQLFRLGRTWLRVQC